MRNPSGEVDPILNFQFPRKLHAALQMVTGADDGSVPGRGHLRQRLKEQVHALAANHLSHEQDLGCGRRRVGLQLSQRGRYGRNDIDPVARDAGDR